MDYNAIADALEAAAETVPGINAFSEVPDDLPSIGFYVGEIDITPNVTMRGQRVGGVRRGTDEAQITCRMLVARFSERGAVRKLRSFMGGSGMNSVLDAIEQNRTLSGSVDDLKVTAIRGNRLFDVGGSKYYGVEFDLFVIGDA